MSNILTIRHQGEQNGEAQFTVTRLSDGKTTVPVIITAPDKITVPNRGNSNLAYDLRWYLEHFLDYPFEPNISLAQEIQDTLEQWSKAAFSNLFQGKARDWYQDAHRNNLSKLTLKIASDDPHVLSWPWEALHDPEGTALAHSCRIERQLNKLHDPRPLPDDMPTNSINILLVIARPYGDEDVSYHVLARPLVELAAQQIVPVRVDVLRPPTFDQLRSTLRKKPGFYHIVHFDGHGGYGEDDCQQNSSNHSFKGSQGRLVFETIEGTADAIESTRLTQLLSEYTIPITVLNACQSAKIDEQADNDPFASVAAALLKAGIRSVVSMGYNLYVSAAQQFVPAFYLSLFQQGSVAEATRAGRQAMLAHPQRLCSRGEHPLYDWMVPVLYQQEAYDLIFNTASQPLEMDRIPLPPAATEQGDYGFIGRDRAIHTLERAIRQQPQAGLLIHGMAGVGKTTLAQGFLQWLQQTGGLLQHVFWFRFDDIRSTEYLINQMVFEFFGTDALASPIEQQLEDLYRVFKEHPYILVWDNFESACGIKGTEITPLLSNDDQALLKNFLLKLRNGKTKILIASRSSEPWLSKTECYRLPIGGLRGEECWQYCNVVVRDLGLTLNRSDPEIQQLIEKLEGHPLAIRAVLLRLDHTTNASNLHAELEQGFAMYRHDESTRRIYTALFLLRENFPTKYNVVLSFIGLHQRYFSLKGIMHMADQSQTKITYSTIESCCTSLERAGLIHIHLYDKKVYSMHPALNGFLRDQYPATQAMQQSFVKIMAFFAAYLTSKKKNEIDYSFYIHRHNFHYALFLAKDLEIEILEIEIYAETLRWFLANIFFSNREFQNATRMLEELMENCVKTKYEIGLARIYHQLGRIASEQRNFTQSEQWYKKSISIKLMLDNRTGLALDYNAIGRDFEESRDYFRASEYYQNSFKIYEELNDEAGLAATNQHLGRMAQFKKEYKTAEQMYLKSEILFKKLNDKNGLAKCYHQLGRVTEEQSDLASAEQWYLKSLAVKDEIGDEHGIAKTYHQLGVLARKRQDFELAKQWFFQTLNIIEKEKNNFVSAGTYGQLGELAILQKDFPSAEKWYLKALPIVEKLGSGSDIVGFYVQLLEVYYLQHHWLEVMQWQIKILVILVKIEDDGAVYWAKKFITLFLHIENSQYLGKFKNLWQQTGLDQAIGSFDDLITKINKETDKL
ncbi:MAG: hypothetical protein NMNS01_28270 [Nitrosomonas sp.]|nr:MAG: hypothetical protein NMNS01_28270 [Nitrosomonas sp.]